MCRPFPGRRCRDGVERRITKLDVQLSAADEKRTRLELERSEYIAANPDTWQGSEFAEENSASLASLEEHVADLVEKRAGEEIDFATTPAGRARLEAAMMDPDLSPWERYQAGVDLNAANRRLRLQQQLAKVLHDPEVPEAVKAQRAEIEAGEADRDAERSEKRADEAEEKVKQRREKKGKDADDPRVESLQREIAYLRRRAQHSKKHSANTRGWLQRLGSKAGSGAWNLNSRMLRLAIRHLF